MDFTPFSTSIEGHSHIAMKVPCNEDGSPKLTIVTGVAPNLKTLDVGNAINNGTLDGKSLDLSAEGRSCLYHAELPNGTTDIALINTSNQVLIEAQRYPALTGAAAPRLNSSLDSPPRFFFFLRKSTKLLRNNFRLYYVALHSL
jgi:hypothetical protein